MNPDIATGMRIWTWSIGTPCFETAAGSFRTLCRLSRSPCSLDLGRDASALSVGLALSVMRTKV